MSLRLDDYMKKNSAYIIIAVLFLIVIIIGRFFIRDNSDYYKDYNRVISEPDSIKAIDNF